MRDIKFRIWDGKYLEYNIFETWSDYVLSEGKLRVVKGPAGGEWTEETDHVLMQYTGLKDKDGVEIYEGDILESSVFIKPLEVFFCEHLGMYRIAYGDDDCGDFIEYASYDFKVIGNIHQNPELLEK